MDKRRPVPKDQKEKSREDANKTEPSTDPGTLLKENEHLRQLVQELTRSAVKAEAANLAKSDFLANMSHELRTPLHAIKSFTHLLLKKSSALMQGLAGVDDPKVRHLLSEVLHLDQEEWQKQSHFWLLRIDENQSRQLNLVNKLLDLVRLESGKQEFHFCEVDLLKIMQSSVEELDTLFSEKSVSLTIQSELKQATHQLDQAQIQTVITNLLSNALKFSDFGGTIILSLERMTNHDTPTFVLGVRDLGPGIPENDLEIIFEPFIQSTQPNERTNGSGLGLAICRSIVVAHGGTIVASNHPDGGALFTVQLPIHCSEYYP